MAVDLMLSQKNLKVLPTEAGHLVNLKALQGKEGRANFAPVLLVATANVASLTGIAALPAYDGVTSAVGDRILLLGQTAATANGIYVVGGGAGAYTLTRAPDANAAFQFVAGKQVYVQDGSKAGFSYVLTDDSNLSTEDVIFGIASTGEQGSDLAYSQDIVGNGSTSTFTITHGLGTDKVLVILRTSTGQQAEISNRVTGINTVVLEAGYNLEVAETYTVTIKPL
jgi:hypothetical protein